MDPASSPSTRPRLLSTPGGRYLGGDGLPAVAGVGHPAGDHRKLAVVRAAIIGAMTILLPPALVGMGYGELALPVFLGALTLLAATAVGYAIGRRTGDVRGAWLFYAAADTLVIVALGVILGSFMDVFLIVVVVELARIYRHGKLVLAA